jgi:outer-membrane receptor for ferric coprogen and ferric-rhodotorulic acid
MTMRHFSRATRPHPFLLNTLSAALLTASAAHAQEVTTPASAAQELDVVTVTASAENDGSASYTVKKTTAATKLNLDLRDTPQSVTVITRERMDDQNMQNLRDVLDNTTGIYSFAYDTERTIFVARDFVIASTLVDGVPTLTRTNSASADSSLDTALYERIEVVRGATGLMTGSGNPSASINLVRKRADSREFTGSADISTGSWNDYRAVVDVRGALSESGNVRARVVGVYQENESYMNFYRNAKDVFYGVIDMDLTPGTTLSVGYDYQKTAPDGITWGWFPLYLGDNSQANWPRSVSTAANWTYWNNTSETAFAELRQELGNDWNLRASYAHRATDGDMALFYVYGFPGPSTGLGLTPYTYRSVESNEQNSGDVYASGPFELLGRSHELVLGATASWSNQRADLYPEDSATLAPVGNFFEWDGSYPMPTYSSSAENLRNIHTDQSGLYSAVRLSLADPLKLILGARYSTWKTDVVDVDNGTFNYDLKETTPYAGVILDVGQDFSVFASYTEIFTPQNKQAVTGAFLNPISGVSQEVGIKGEHFDGRLNTALTLFDTRQDNVATADVGHTLPDGITQAYYGVDGASSRGFELEVNGELTPGWNTSLGWSYSKLKDADDHKINAYIPTTLIRLFTSWTLPGNMDKLKIGGGINWQSKSELEATCPNGVCAFEQGNVFILSLMARYQFTPKFSAQLNADNLLDKTYYVVGEYDSVNYAPPVNATLALNYKF